MTHISSRKLRVFFCSSSGRATSFHEGFRFPSGTDRKGEAGREEDGKGKGKWKVGFWECGNVGRGWGGGE